MQPFPVHVTKGLCGPLTHGMHSRELPTPRAVILGLLEGGRSWGRAQNLSLGMLREVASSQGGILAGVTAGGCVVPPLGGPATSEEGSRAQQAGGCKPGWDSGSCGLSRAQAGRPWLRPRPCCALSFPSWLAFSRREKQQKVVLPEPCRLPSFQEPEPFFGGLLPSVSRVSAQNPRSGQGSPGLSAGLGALHGHSLWPRHGNLPGSSAALDSDLASPYRKHRGDW